jgi:hypothetical protein
MSSWAIGGFSRRTQLRELVSYEWNDYWRKFCDEEQRWRGYKDLEVEI